MFGQNPTRPIEHDGGKDLRVQEIFYTIQGEGPFSGMPCTFIRLAGCNLRCHFCFVGTTSIRMADGTSKRIDEVQQGDEVLSFLDGVWVPRVVVRTMTSDASRVLRVKHGGEKTFVTADHPFLVRDRGWVPAEDLRAGDKLIHLSNAEQRRLWNPMKDPEVAARAHLGRDYGNNRLQKLWANPDERAAAVRRMRDKNPMKDPAVAIKGFLNRKDHKMTRAEQTFARICDGLPIEYCGAGTLIIDNKVPDFVVDGERKVIEVWAADSLHGLKRGARWRNKRREHFEAQGYEVLFVPMPAAGVRDGAFEKIRERVSQFCFNGDTVEEVTEVVRGGKAWVRLAGSASGEVPVFNLEVEESHNYVANGVVAHNCDTEFESGYNNRLSLAHIIKALDFESEFVARRSELVVLTGGEPMIQNVVPLIESLLQVGVKTVQIETAGTVWVPGLEKHIDSGRVVLVCSPKTPKVHPMIVRHCQHWKYVISHKETDPTDGLPCMSTQKAGESAKIYRAAEDGTNTIWVSPCDSHEAVRSYMNLTEAKESALKHGHRLSLQVHKIIDVR